MKRTAIVSDVHSNLEALENVMEDAREQGCEEIVCLGDLIGYGPNPRQVLRIALEHFEFTLMGNHEEGILYQPVGFNWKAEASAWWTKDQLRSTRFPGDENKHFLKYLEQLPRYATHGDVLYVQGKKIKITADRPNVPVQMDGDNAGTLPCEIEVRHKVVRMLVPGQASLRGSAAERSPAVEAARAQLVGAGA